MRDVPAGWSAPLIDVEMPRGRFARRRARLVANEEILRLGNDVIPVDAVETVAYQASGSRLVFEVTGAGGTISIRETNSGARSAAAVERWEALVALSRRCIEPRLRAGAIECMHRGLPIAIGAVTMTTDGISGRSRRLRRSVTVPWSDVRRCTVSSAEVVVESGDRIVLSESMLTPNAPLLPDLVEAVRAD